MKPIRRYFARISIEFSEKKVFQNTAVAYAKLLYFFVLLKWLFLYDSFRLFFQGYSPRLPPSLYRIYEYPWFHEHFGYVFFVFMIVVTIALISRHHIIWAVLVFWMNINLYTITFPIKNGGDIVLNLLLFMNIFMSPWSVRNIQWIKMLKNILQNFVVIFARVQIGLIYFLSGWDKLLSPEWRSGDAVRQISTLDLYMYPLLLDVNIPPALQLTLAWLIIVFELSFVVLVFIPKTRVPVLLAGVIFHLAIASIISLPLFGIIMIISYSIYLTDEEAGWVVNWFHRVKKSIEKMRPKEVFGLR